MAGDMKRISTHVLDTTRGKPAAAVPVQLERRDAQGKWVQLSSGQTDQEGRCAQLLPDGADLVEGIYKLSFETAAYFLAQGTQGLYPVVEITFQVRGGESHFHIPLLLSPNGYTTYRGS
jgi:5-hydroxyisourate hydrolase